MNPLHLRTWITLLPFAGKSLLERAYLKAFDRQLRVHIERQQHGIKSVLDRFFDPKDGQVTERLHAFVSDMGVLATMLQEFVGGEGSVLAQTLSRQAGENSPLLKRLSPTAEAFHENNSQHYELKPGETMTGAWTGLQFTPALEGLGAKAGAAAKEAAAGVIGISSYVPRLHIGLTSTGRLLVAREFSEMLQRDSFEQILSLPGASAQEASTSTTGGPLGKVPGDPLSPGTKLQFVQLSSNDGQSYEAWLSTMGTRVGEASFHAITQI